MKLLVLNPFGVDIYDEMIGETVKKVGRPGTEVVVEHLDRGLSFIRHAYFQMLMVPDIVERIIQAEKEGFDGATVACAFDPGIKEAREVVDIPVVGQAQSSVAIANQIGQKFGVITDAKRAVAHMLDLFRMYRMDTNMIDLVAVEMNVEDMEKGRSHIRNKVCDLAKELVNRGADSIVIACSVLSAYTFGMEKPAELKGVPFIDCNLASVKTLEMMVDLKGLNGIGASRHIYYQKPQVCKREDFDLARKVYMLPPLND
jgi:allantoin racemase